MNVKSSLKFKKVILTAITLVMFAGIFITSFNKTFVSSANAGLNFCGTMGHNLQLTSNDAPSARTSYNKKWNVSELFSNQVDWSMYYGEGKGDFFYADKEDYGSGKSTMYNESVKEVVEQPGLRSLGRCVVPGLKTAFPTVFFSITKLVAGLVTSFLTALFDGGVVSESIVKVIGGEGTSGGGLIRALTSGIYMPLMMFAILALAVWIIHTGIIKRQFREALSGMLWSLIAFFIGIMLLYNPAMVAKAPRVITSTISECVVGAISGSNCVTGESNQQISSFVGTECLTYDNGDKGIGSLTRGMTCSVWKTFVLDTWAQGQFGLPYNELYLSTTNMPTDGVLWGGANNLSASDIEKFGVSLKSTGSEKDYKNKVIETSSEKVYNLALYHLYLRSTVEDVSNGRTAIPGVYNVVDNSVQYTYDSEDPRFYNLISAISEDKVMFDIWSNKGTASSRSGNAFISMIGMILAGALLIVLSVFGMSYEVISTITILFAPIFFLFALHPGKGRKIFLGWVETLVSAFMKYFATILFVIVALMLYSAVLQNTSGPMAFLSVLVLSSALFAYRKEVINLLGVVNMGGTRMTNALGKKMEEAGKKTKNMANAAAGSAVGAKLAGGDILEGAKSGLKREIKRGRSFTAQATQQFDRTKKRLDNSTKNDIKDTQSDGENTVDDDNNLNGGNFNGSGNEKSAEWIAKEENMNSVLDSLQERDHEAYEKGESSDEVGSFIDSLSNGKIDGEDREIALDVLVQRANEDGVTMADNIVNSTISNEDSSLNSLNLAKDLTMRSAVIKGELTNDDLGKLTTIQEKIAEKQVSDPEKRSEFVKTEVDKLQSEVDKKIAKRNSDDTDNSDDDIKPSGPSSANPDSSTKPAQPTELTRSSRQGDKKVEEDKINEVKTNDEVKSPSGLPSSKLSKRDTNRENNQDSQKSTQERVDEIKNEAKDKGDEFGNLLDEINED